LGSNRPTLNTFLQSRDDLAYFQPEFGTVAFPALKTGSVADLDRLLREKYETSIVPGRYFDKPQHFRVGIGGDPEMTSAAFERLAMALDELQS
jgi:aspartate/methionine/tyrosine aminotransferase